MTFPEWMRQMPSLSGHPLHFDPEAAPDEPSELFVRWLREAVEHGVAEPLAMTLATVDGVPDARTLLLKDVGADGFAFAGHRRSAKASQLACAPTAALTFWWQPIMRAVRVRGHVVEASAEESAADLRARSAAAQEGIAPEDWVLWRLDPTAIEFWQGAADRRHTRLQYTRTDRMWHHAVHGGNTDPTRRRTRMSDYQVTQIGALDEWRDHFGGFAETSSRDGRRVVDHELAMQYIGLTANALEPGEQAGYWHQHAKVEELYVFLEGRGQMGLDDEVIDVTAGSVVRVGQGVWRTWRAHPDSPGQLRWLCIRAGGETLPHRPDDSTRAVDRPLPW